MGIECTARENYDPLIGQQDTKDSDGLLKLWLTECHGQFQMKSYRGHSISLGSRGFRSVLLVIIITTFYIGSKKL